VKKLKLFGRLIIGFLVLGLLTFAVMRMRMEKYMDERKTVNSLFVKMLKVPPVQKSQSR